MSAIHRVLLVDDYEPWRRHVDSVLQNGSGWQVVGEASDGHEAIQKALTLRPDLILLDVGLPTLNGISAARKILARDPGLKILIVSEHRSWDVAEAALSAGARGYLVKSDAGVELLPAMAAVVEGAQFISASLSGSRHKTNLQPLAQGTIRHMAGFYSDEAFLLDDSAGFAEAVLKAGKSLIAVGVDSHRRMSLERELAERGIDVDRTIREGRYLWSDVADALSGIMVDDLPDAARFWKKMTACVTDAANASTAEHPRVAAWGECAPTLWREGKTEAAVRLEQMWDELARRYSVDLLCSYPSKDLLQGEDSRAFEKICAAHSAVHSR